MMRMTSGLGCSAALLSMGLALGTTAPLRAQSLGVFRWQLQPFCNVVTVTVVQQGAQYHIDGTDDLCGASRIASVVGRAFPNPDGTIGFGLTTVSTTGAAPVHLDARISIATISGPWTDSAGNSGTFAFTPGTGTGGSVRPIPPGGIAPGTITGAQIGAGAITATQLAAGSVTAEQLAPGAITTGLIAGAVAGFGTCPAGQYLRGIQPSGTVICEPIGTPPLSTNVDTASSVGHFSSMAIGSDGLPVISHWDRIYGDLRVTHCSTVACTAATSTSVDTANVVCLSTSIAIGTDGLPVISHYDETNGDLRVTHCGNVTCTNANTSTSVDTANDVGPYTSIAIGTDGLPVISYPDVTNHDLRVTHCSNVACTAATSTSADVGNNLGLTSSIAIGTDGLPVISHREGTNDDLRVTKCNSRTCQ